MKKIFLLMLLVCIYTIGITQNKKQINDGIYLVEKTMNNSNTVTPSVNHAVVQFNPDFPDAAPDGASGLLINTADFVPLELAEEPLLLQQTDNKKKLELSFSPAAAAKLEKFTSDHIMNQAAMVVNGQTITMNKIRDTIRNGKMEITSSSDNACESIYAALKSNVTIGK